MVDVDVHVPTYENDTGYKLYSGLKQLSQIDDHFTMAPTVCEHSVGKWNEAKKDWEKVKAIILSDGSLRLDPAATCDSCFIFFLKKNGINFHILQQNTILDISCDMILKQKLGKMFVI